MKILVTGALGFIGSNLVPKLLSQGHQVIGIDSLVNPSINPTDRIKASAGSKWEHFKFFNTDIRATKEIKNLIFYEKAEALIHLAALGSVQRSFADPYETTSTNEGGFVAVVKLCSEVGIKRLVFASSSSVYGDHPTAHRREGYEGQPLSPYALSKVMNEKFARLFCPMAEINYAGLRFFNVYGPGQRPDSPYSSVIPRFINEPKPEVYGDGLQTRDFTYIEDVCDAVIAALNLTANRDAAILNVGTGKPTSLLKLLDLTSGPGNPITKKPDRKGDVKDSFADTSKAAEILGWEAKVSVEEGIKLTKTYYDKLYNRKVKPNGKEAKDKALPAESSQEKKPVKTPKAPEGKKTTKEAGR